MRLGAGAPAKSSSSGSGSGTAHVAAAFRGAALTPRIATNMSSGKRGSTRGGVAAQAGAR